MTFKFYNSQSRSVQEFQPADNTVRIYSCGPTVYDLAHIGNFRSYVFSDVLRRSLKLGGFQVEHAMNITDVDDKTIDRTTKKNPNAGISDLKDYTDLYIREFFSDADQMEIEKVEHYPRATEYIDSMLSLTKKLIDKGYGYEMDGSVYFSINKFPEYGNLSGIDLNSVKHGVRYSADEYTKEDVRDFVLWKAGKENENIFWECEYGKGRPGWHLECSAMIHEIFNRPIDIHTGGVDLLFPHHENEIAQSVNAYEHPFVKYWMHCEHLLVDGKKMSKSDGNFFTIQDLIKENIHPLAIRYFLMSSHYRQKLNFTREAIQQTSQTIRKIWNFYLRLTSAIAKGVVSDKEKALHPQMESWKSKFLEELQDDLNTPRALAVFHDAIRESNYLLDEQKDILSNETKTKLVAVFQRMDSVLGILSGSETIAAQDREGLPEDLQRLLDQRNQARKDKDFVSADRFRDQIQSRGYEILDTQDGTRLLKKT